MPLIDGVSERPSRRYYDGRDTRSRPSVSPPTPTPAAPAKKRRRRQLLVIPAIFVVALLAGLVVWHPGRKSTADSLPANVLSQVSGFKAYYFVNNPTDFRLVASSVDYQSNVLVFSMSNPAGKSLAFTEEATPPGYDISGLQADKQFNTEYGQAFITDAPTRTTGALFTSDHTWILINAPTPIGAALMQTILNALKPLPAD